jgi:hypothetical protein
MSKVLAAAVFLGLSLNLAAQTRGAHASTAAMSGTTHGDLSSTLSDLERVAQATHSDLSNLRIDKWGSAAWKTAWLKKNSHQQQAEQAQNSLKRNLIGALPGIIADVRASRGSVSTTFKLYDDVTLVCETLDSLVSATESYGKKEEYGPLAEDYSALVRVRRSLSAYISQRASANEGRGNMTYAYSAPPSTSSRGTTTSVSSDGVKRIVIDDTVPDTKPAAKKKAAVRYTNDY